MSDWLTVRRVSRCPKCGSTDVEQRSWAVSGGGSESHWSCNDCGHTSEEPPVDQHPSDTIAFRESFQCSDHLYEFLRTRAKAYLRNDVETPPVDLDQIGLRRFIFEDGVISFDATHPHVEHEDVAEGDVAEGIEEAEQ